MKPIIIGSGQYNWDIIKLREYPNGFVIGKRNTFVEKILCEVVGGTCGNVICMLSYLGWDARPQVKLIDSDEGKSILTSLQSFGCDTRYVSLDPKGGFSGMTCTHRKSNKTGEHELGLRSFGPNGSQFRKITELRARDEVPAFLETITDRPAVYFFDHMEAGPRLIASELRNKGTLVYFECENSKDWKKFMKSVEVADIVKFSDENVTDLSFVTNYPDKLFIQTQGSNGLSFSLCAGKWIHLDAYPVSKVIDWEGCGDTTTAVFIDELSKIGLPSVSNLTEKQVISCLKVAMEKASLCCQFYGSKGWIKDENR
jgi:sugar/nucleoside kinase (ribokinase family)